LNWRPRRKARRNRWSLRQINPRSRLTGLAGSDVRGRRLSRRAGTGVRGRRLRRRFLDEVWIEHHLAIFAVNGAAKPLRLTEGEDVSGWRIESITPHEVSLSGPGGTKTLQPKLSA
jgi:hypothetical protein